MPRIITNLCLRDGSCVEVCPVDCISPGKPIDQFPTYYIDPDACIDCGACEVECPNSAIFELDLIPDHFAAEGGEILVAPAGTPGFDEDYNGENHNGEPVHIPAAKTLEVDEVVDLTDSIEQNALYFSEGPGYTAQ